MAFEKNPKAAMTGTPLLVELDGGIATMSNGAQFQFPAGTTFENANDDLAPTKQIQRITGPKLSETHEPPSFTILKGATLQTVLTAIERCVKGI